MKKSNCFIARVLAIVLIFGMAFTSCATTYHSVEIANVRNVREVYIRNAGSSSWGQNLAGNLQEIDRSKFSDRVDVRVVDTNGIVYSSHNVPFNDNAFVQANKTSRLNRVGRIALFSPLVVLGIVLGVVLGGN